jgi:hypothetical protein
MISIRMLMRRVVRPAKGEAVSRGYVERLAILAMLFFAALSGSSIAQTTEPTVLWSEPVSPTRDPIGLALRDKARTPDGKGCRLSG